MPDAIRFLPLTPDLIPAFTDLFGPRGACYGCWCTAFLLRPKQRQAMTEDQRRDVMLDRISAGPPPGILAFRGDEVIGWMQIGPRAGVPEWNNPNRSSSPLPDGPADDPSVWAITCFFFRSRERGKGLSHPMVRAGLAFAREKGARLVEVSPMDRARQSKSIGLFVGSTSVFLKAGFTEMARAKPGRPLMRLAL
ncbi:MAG: GNAT family N-acetyltransferase [Paracoccaceae bacterium]